MRSVIARRRERKERGAAVVEFAIALPIFIGLMLLIFDAGLGFSASRTSASAARSAARIGALAGDAPDADYRVLSALQAEFGGPRAEGDDGSVSRIVIYLSDPSNASGLPPAGCVGSSQEGVCNSYPASILDSLTPETFDIIVDPITGEESCGPPHDAWCPLDRRLNDGGFLGVYIASEYDTTTGIEASAFDLKDRAVFKMFFPAEPELLDAGGE